jgi:hypothetical protein
MTNRRTKLATIALGLACTPFLCCWIVIASCCCPRRLRPHGESGDRRRFEKRQAMAPRPLPVRPPERTLSIRNHTKETENDAKPQEPRGLVRDQSTSRLMRLPLELRQMIYRAAIGDSVMHMVIKKRKLGHQRCKARSIADCLEQYTIFMPDNVWSPLGEPMDNPPATDGDILPLLLTCRQMKVPKLRCNLARLTSGQILRVNRLPLFHQHLRLYRSRLPALLFLHHSSSTLVPHP